MKVFAVRINADPRKGRPYSAYPSQNEYKKIHSKSVGNGFHEAVNFLEEKGMVHGYLPPKPSIELQRSDSFTLVSMSYKGQSSAPDRVFGIQSDCKFVGSTERKNSHGPDLDWHFVCKAENSILFPAGLPNAFASLIGDNPKDWFRGGPTKRIGANRFINFVSAVNDPALEPRRLARFYNFRDRLLSDA